jgi:hypothetical protein
MLLGTATFLCLVTRATLASESFFRDCASALESPDFQRLKTFYSSRTDEPRPDSCFRLNNNEFLVTVTNAGRVSQGLYYYYANDNTYGLVDRHYWPEIEVKREFVGPNQKRFVLISTSNLHHGNWEYGYQILYLVPGKKIQSFVVKELIAAKENPVDGFCGRHGSDGIELTDTATSIKGFQIVGEGSDDIRLEFTVEEEDCNTRKHRSYMRVFHPQAGDFIEE